MRKGWKCYDWSAWRRERCRQALLRPFSAKKGLVRKVGTDFLEGSVATGKSIMVLN